MLRPVSNGPPPVVARATLVSVLADAVRDVLDGQTGPAESYVRHVVPRHPGCPADVECLPLRPLLDDVLDDPSVTVGHLHRAADGSGSVPLTVFGRLIAAHVTRDLLDIRLARSEHDVANLKVALESSRVIGVAIGILMATRHCTAVEAFDQLKLASQSQNRKLREVAAEVEFTGTVLRAAPDRQRA